MNDAIRIARVRLTHAVPHFAPMVMAMRLVECRELPFRMAVDSHGRCYWHPGKCAGVPMDQLAGTMLHEVSHLLRHHHVRAREAGINPGGPEHFRWNVAADFEINDDQTALPLPPGCIHPKDLSLPSGQLAEWYYRKLPAPAAPPKGSPGDGVPGGGSAADGIPREYELPADSDDAPGLSPTEIEMLARQVAQATRSCGHASAGWRRWAEVLLAPPVVPWWRELRSHFRRLVGQAAGRRDYTWSKVPRREPLDPAILAPAMHRPTVAVAAIIDTSGSMDEGQGMRCLSELRGLIRALDLPVDVISCDAAAAVSRRILSPRRAIMLGGGGTDMRVAILTAQRLRPTPAVIVTMTDGLTPWPAEAPRGAAHITLLLGDGKPPAWGRVIHVIAT